MVKGTFQYQAPGETASTTYSYALFYLGVNDEQRNGGVNQIGWAVAQTPQGPYKRVSVTAPW